MHSLDFAPHNVLGGTHLITVTNLAHIVAPYTIITGDSSTRLINELASEMVCP